MSQLPSAPSPRVDPAVSPAPESARWLARAARLGLPLGASVAVHAALAGVLVWAAVTWRAAPPVAAPGAEVFVGDGPLQLPATEPAPPLSPSSPASKPGPVSSPGAPAVAVEVAGAADAEPVAAAAPGATADRPRPATEPPTAGGVGASGALAAALAAPGPSVSFAGLASPPGERVASVVYVVDASGPMVSSLPDVLAEVRRSVDALAPTQRFGVVVFQGGDGPDGAAAARSFSAAPVDASARNRAALAHWLAGVQPSGPSAPLEGLALALAMNPRPQVVFLLTRSISRSGGGAWDLGPERTLAALDRLNPLDQSTRRRPTIIRTIQFIDPDPTGITRSIAAYHGSGDLRRDHRVLGQRELNAR